MARVREGEMTALGAVLIVGRAQKEGDRAEGAFRFLGSRHLARSIYRDHPMKPSHRSQGRCAHLQHVDEAQR